MNIPIKIFFLCPIPEEQKPIYEYVSLKENLLTNWTTLSAKKYFSKLRFSVLFLFFFLLFFQSISLGFFNFFVPAFFQKLVSGLDAISSWQIFQEKLRDTIPFSFLSVSFFFVCFFLILLFRWMQLQLRFATSRLIYEEASWYDGQIWEKPFALMKNEKLIITQKINPIKNRLLKTFQFFFFSFLLFLFYSSISAANFQF
jgi:hypothetical protein